MLNFTSKPIKLNTEFFIAKKMYGSKDSKQRISRPIVNISLISIILGLAVMIITVSIVTGFQNKIREKVIGFGSHIQITNMEDNTSMESSPLLIDTSLVQELKANPHVRHIQHFALKPAILQSDQNSTTIHAGQKTDTVNNRDILGVLFKGIDQSYDLNFFKDKMVSGQIIDFQSQKPKVLISTKIAQLLQYEVGDEINAYFILNNTPKKRSFEISGIYETGLEEFDKKIIFTNITSLQSISNWGVTSAITIQDTCINNKYVLKGLNFGNYSEYNFKWNELKKQNNFYLFNGTKNQTIKFSASGIDKSSHTEDLHWDTSTAKILVDSVCECSEKLLAENPITFISENLIKMPFGKIEILNGQGNGHQFVGGYEVLINEWKDLEKMDSIIYNSIPFELKTTKITDLYTEIFAWLNFLDMNIAVIILMMLIVSLINMITSLLVLIIEKTNFIGILKAIGATNFSIRKIFIFNALILLKKGLIWGNLLGIAFILLQNYFNIFPLNPEIYYLDAVPVSFNLWNILMINGLTIISCFLVLIIPSYLTTKIKAIKAIKFN